MLPARFAPIAIALILSGIMSFLVSGIATVRAIGTPPEFVGSWISAWLFAWAVAFPTLMVFRPLVTRLVQRITQTP